MKRRYVRVTFSDGDSLETWINGTEATVRDYYLNNWFNHGDTEAHPADKMVRGVRVEFLEGG